MYWEDSPPLDKAGHRNRQLPRQIAVTFLPLIRARALRLARRLPSHVLIDDLVAAGFVGLVDAYRNYREASGEPFEPYANARIQGAMLDELRSADPLSRPLRALAREIRKVTRRLEARLGRSPDDHEVASEIGWTVETLRTRTALIATGSAMAHTHDVHDEALEIADPFGADVEGQLTSQKVTGAVQRAVEALPERLKSILEMRYGEELTLRDIGGILGVTESRVWQLHAEAIAQIRDSARMKSSFPQSG
jgi:RNA polymerase sigma factor for flagellar operon FliA